MASTFLNLCAYADWSNPTPVSKEPEAKEHKAPQVSKSEHEITVMKGFDLNYDIHIHLPATRDQAIYDSLFASLAKHLPLK